MPKRGRNNWLIINRQMAEIAVKHAHTHTQEGSLWGWRWGFHVKKFAWLVSLGKLNFDCFVFICSGRPAVVYIYPVEPNLCDASPVTDSILGEYMVDEMTSMYIYIYAIPWVHSYRLWVMPASTRWIWKASFLWQLAFPRFTTTNFQSCRPCIEAPTPRKQLSETIFELAD